MADRRAWQRRGFERIYMRVADQNGSSVYDRSHGGGAPVLLIHGLEGSSAARALEMSRALTLPDDSADFRGHESALWIPGGICEKR
jgi:pimeloyl-ACP methyl ester carboxylesterase